MLELAINYEDDVNKLLRKMALDLKYKYYFIGHSAPLVFSPKESTWEGLQFVSINNKKVTGYIYVAFERPFTRATIHMYNTNGNVFMEDLDMLIGKLFKEFKIPKLTFDVLIGNRAEKLYDRFVKNNNGRIVGIFKSHDMNYIGEICDTKMYEVLREDYLKESD